MKQKKPFAEKWRIVEMEVWDQDYVDMEVPGYIRIGSDGNGPFQFGLVSGDIDGRVEQCGNRPRFEFSWWRQEENDPVCGRPEDAQGLSSTLTDRHIGDNVQINPLLIGWKYGNCPSSRNISQLQSLLDDWNC